MKLLLGLSIFLAVVVSAEQSFAQQRFLLEYSSFSANQMPIWFAEGEGLFKRFDIMPDLIVIGARAK